MVMNTQPLHPREVTAGNLSGRRQRPPRALAAQLFVSPQVPEKIRRLVDTVCAAYGGPERMSLSQWLEAEQQFKTKFQNELEPKKQI